MEEQTEQTKTKDLKVLKELIEKVDPDVNIYKETTTLIEKELNKEASIIKKKINNNQIK